MRHSSRAALVWWLGVGGCATLLATAWNGYRLDQTAGLPVVHMASAVTASWIVIPVIAWFALFGLGSHGWKRSWKDVAISATVVTAMVGLAATGFLAWERSSHAASHNAAFVLALVCVVCGLGWFARRRSALVREPALNERSGESTGRRAR